MLTAKRKYASPTLLFISVYFNMRKKAVNRYYEYEIYSITIMAKDIKKFTKL